MGALGCGVLLWAACTTDTTTDSARRTTGSGAHLRAPGHDDGAMARRCGGKPGRGTTGATGTLPRRDQTEVESGTELHDATVTSLNVTGSDVVIRNVKVETGILITGDRVTIDHVTTQGIAVSSASDVTIRFTDIGFGSDDGIHITSDRGRLARNITLSNNYIHDPRVEPTAHYDGTQVRGVDGLTIRCSSYDPGPYQAPYNAAIYLEDANGGDTDVVVRDNWIKGFGYSFMVAAKNVSIVDNVLGGDTHWGVCYLGEGTSATAVTARGNVADGSGRPVTVCSDKTTTR